MRALLDTNVWRYVVDAGLQGDLLRLAKSGLHDVQIAPGVVYESLRLNDPRLLAAIVALQTKPQFKRLMPEAYSEGLEILETIKRIRPDWLRKEPNLVFYNRLRQGWSRKTGGFWVRTASSPLREKEAIGDHREWTERSRAEFRANREQMRLSDWKQCPPLNKVLGAPGLPTPGWNGKPVEAWRVERLNALTWNLQRTGYALRDWLAPFVELDDGLLFSSAWGEFWLHLVEPTDVPRQWLRWAHTFAQRFRKVSPGAGGDTQLFTYILETDVLVSADKALLDILEDCRPFAPRELPAGHLVAGGVPGARDLLSLLAP